MQHHWSHQRRARTDLETLVDTSPVGVVVFDAGSARPVSFNREARRIAEALTDPDQSLERLLEILTCRRADGREVSMAEFPLSLSLASGETVRAEEIELSVPDGRRVATLVNATPISDADGAVVSVVVTLQDLAPLEELDRLRAEFLGMVSHELRAPLTAIKGSAARVLGAPFDLDPAEMRAFFRIVDAQADHMYGLIGDLLDAGRIDAGTLTVSPEPADIAALVDEARNTFLSGGARHTVQIDLPPELPRAMAERRRIVQVLNNLLANAARHSPESLPIRVAAERDGGPGARRRRRSADPALRARRPRRHRLRPARDGRPAGSGEAASHGTAGDRPPRPDAARHQRYRADGEHPGNGGRAGHFHLRLRPRRDHRARSRPAPPTTSSSRSRRPS